MIEQLLTKFIFQHRPESIGPAPARYSISSFRRASFSVLQAPWRAENSALSPLPVDCRLKMLETERKAGRTQEISEAAYHVLQRSCAFENNTAGKHMWHTGGTEAEVGRDCT